jgi:hypothetical protein
MVFCLIVLDSGTGHSRGKRLGFLYLLSHLIGSVRGKQTEKMLDKQTSRAQ